MIVGLIYMKEFTARNILIEYHGAGDACKQNDALNYSLQGSKVFIQVNFKITIDHVQLGPSDTRCRSGKGCPPPMKIFRDS